MPRAYCKKARLYNEETIAKALLEIESGASVNQTSKKYFMKYSMLYSR